MGPTITATAYGLAAIFAALFVRPRMIESRAVLRAAAFWVISVPILFLIPLPMLCLLTLAPLVLILAPREKGDRLAYYFLVFPAVPAGIEDQIPFPGLNYLFTLDFPKVVFFAALTAAFFASSRPPAARYAPSIGVFVILLTLLYSIMAFRDDNLTNGLRSALNYALTYAFPFLGLIRLMEKDEALDKVFAGFVFLACVFFFSALASQFKKWNFYDFLTERLGQPGFMDIRSGVMRVGVTLNPALTGYVMGLGLLAVSYFRNRKLLKAPMAWVYRFMFALAAYFTYSRGAWLAIAMGLAVYLFVTKFPRGVRPAALALGAFVGAPAAIYYALTADFGAIDAYGTFAYRQELLRATFIHFQQFPLFGDAFFYNRPHFAHLVQGQGIIDFVNRYVQILVEYGAVGLALFLAPWIALALGLLNLPARTRDFSRNFWGSPAEFRRAALLAVVASYLTLIATISDVSYIKHFGVAILALGAGYLATVRAQIVARRGAQGAATLKGDIGGDLGGDLGGGEPIGARIAAEGG